MDNYTVLIIDDGSDIRTLASEYIRELGKFKYIVEASNGAEGLKKCENQSFDLIIVDLMMPVMDGFKFVEGYQELEKRKLKLNKNMTKSQLLILSANITESAVKNLLENKVKHFLTKPFSGNDLTEKINSLLDLEKVA